MSLTGIYGESKNTKKILETPKEIFVIYSWRYSMFITTLSGNWCGNWSIDSTFMSLSVNNAHNLQISAQI